MAIKKFTYTNGHLLKADLDAEGYDETIRVRTADEMIKNEHYFHQTACSYLKLFGRWQMFPEYIQIKEDQKGSILISKAATCDICNMNFSIDLLHLLIEQLAESVCLLHTVGIAHRDIKDANVLWVGESRIFQLADFGCACSISPSESNTLIQKDMMQCCIMLRKLCQMIKVDENPLLQKFITLYSKYKTIYACTFNKS